MGYGSDMTSEGRGDDVVLHTMADLVMWYGVPIVSMKRQWADD
jgi:hypothetical protein